MSDEQEYVESLERESNSLRKERDAAVGALERKGYRKSCDIPACNCWDQWSHGGHAEERLREIADEVWENGVTTLESIKKLRAAITRKDEVLKQITEVELHNTFTCSSGEFDPCCSVCIAKRALESKL